MNLSELHKALESELSPLVQIDTLPQLTVKQALQYTCFGWGLAVLEWKGEELHIGDKVYRLEYVSSNLGKGKRAYLLDGHGRRFSKLYLIGTKVYSRKELRHVYSYQNLSKWEQYAHTSNLWSAKARALDGSRAFYAGELTKTINRRDYADYKAALGWAGSIESFYNFLAREGL